MQDGRLLLVKIGGAPPLGIDGGIIDVEMDVRHRHIQVSMTNFAAMGVQNLGLGCANAPPSAMLISLDLCEVVN